MHSTSLFVILSQSWNNNNWSKLSTNAGCETQEFMQWTGPCPQAMGFLSKSKIKHNRRHSSCQHMQWWGENDVIAPLLCFSLFIMVLQCGACSERTWCISWSLPQATGDEDVLRQAVAAMFLSAAELLLYSEWGRLKEQPQNDCRSCCDRFISLNVLRKYSRCRAILTSALMLTVHVKSSVIRAPSPHSCTVANAYS